MISRFACLVAVVLVSWHGLPVTAQLEYSLIDDAPSNEYYSSECYSVRGPSGLRYSYCVHRPIDEDRRIEKVLLYLHGATDDEFAWIRSEEFGRTQARLTTVQRLLYEGGQLPTVITVSFGSFFVLTPTEVETFNPLGRTKYPNSATLENYLEAVKAIEVREELPIGPRWVMGLSQGGLSALELLLLYGNSTIDGLPLDTPEDRFADRFVSLNAMLPFCEPFAIGLPSVCWVIFNAAGGPGFLAETNFRDDEHWRSADPTGALGELKLNSALPPFQVQFALDDEWRLEVQNGAFVSNARVKGAPVDAVANPGNHQDFCAEGVVAFLQGLRDDRLGDEPDICVPIPLNDDDADGKANPDDNCPHTYNPSQDDADNDGIGDVCDSLAVGDGDAEDFDRDGVADIADNCPLIYNPAQLDGNENGIGTDCDPSEDADRDGHAADDNCPESYNKDQLDVDGDGIGAACDPSEENPDDIDGDGVLNVIDNCPSTYNPDQRDLDGDGIGLACEDSIDIQVSGCGAVGTVIPALTIASIYALRSPFKNRKLVGCHAPKKENAC